MRTIGLLNPSRIAHDERDYRSPNDALPKHKLVPGGNKKKKETAKVAQKASEIFEDPKRFLTPFLASWELGVTHAYALHGERRQTRSES
jgi:hypothetical protein